MIDIIDSPPYATVQDRGRPRYRSQGVPSGGAMDPWALCVANVLVGNDPGAAAVEWALGGGRVRWERPAMFALAGARVEATLDGAPVQMHRSYRAAAGSELTVRRLESGRFVYIGLDGGVGVPVVLGSRATYMPARMGGVEGRLLRAGDRIDLGQSRQPYPIVGFATPPDLEPRYDTVECRVVAGPHASLFGPDDWARFTDTAYRVDPASDRTGFRLAGPVLQHRGDATLPSAPVCPGAIQVPSGGAPIVLMADAPTVGGYPVIAVVCSADLPLVAQRRPGEELRFRVISIEDAQRALRRRAMAVHTLAALVRETIGAPR
jgi:antagonist of KipI